MRVENSKRQKEGQDTLVSTSTSVRKDRETRRKKKRNIEKKKNSLPKCNEITGKIKPSTPIVQVVFNLVSIKVFEKDTVQFVHSRIVIFCFAQA